MDDVPPVRAPPFRTSSDPEVPVAVAASKPKQVRHLSGEDGGELRRPVDSPARRDIGGRKAVNDSPQRYDRGGSSANPPRGGSRLSGTSDRSIEHSPLHPHYQARAVNKGSVNSPSWERKVSSEGGRGSSHGVAPSNPARPKLRSVNDETVCFSFSFIMNLWGMSGVSHIPVYLNGLVECLAIHQLICTDVALTQGHAMDTWTQILCLKY